MRVVVVQWWYVAMCFCVSVLCIFPAVRPVVYCAGVSLPLSCVCVCALWCNGVVICVCVGVCLLQSYAARRCAAVPLCLCVCLCVPMC